MKNYYYSKLYLVFKIIICKYNNLFSQSTSFQKSNLITNRIFQYNTSKSYLIPLGLYFTIPKNIRPKSLKSFDFDSNDFQNIPTFFINLL